MSDESVMIERLRDEYDCCKQDGADDIAILLDDAAAMISNLMRRAANAAGDMAAEVRQSTAMERLVTRYEMALRDIEADCPHENTRKLARRILAEVSLVSVMGVRSPSVSPAHGSALGMGTDGLKVPSAGALSKADAECTCGANQVPCGTHAHDCPQATEDTR